MSFHLPIPRLFRPPFQRVLDDPRRGRGSLRWLGALLALAALLVGTSARGNEAAVRKGLATHSPGVQIDEVRSTPIPGLFEVRIGSDVFYSDATGRYLLQGDVVDLKGGVNLTRQRIDGLTAFDFKALPLNDAVRLVQGNGSRQMAVFVDPNCGYCKRFEADVAALKDVTLYVFLYPILGQDSQVKSRDIWCSMKPAQAWRDWMLANKVPPSTAGRKCDDGALQRNVALGRKHRVQGTPAAVFVDGSRAPGAIPKDELEKRLTAAVAPKG